jgi:ATP-dependent Clp protease protease subunit
MAQLAFKKHGYEVTNEGGIAYIRIVGDINWWNNGSEDFTRMLAELRAAGVTELVGYINTGGGSMWEANEIYNQLVAFPGRKTAVLGALVASAGTTIACAFKDGIEMAANGQYMIHNPHIDVSGGEAELRSALQLYANIRQAAINIYVKFTAGKAGSDEAIGAMMDATTWMTAAQAKEKGFITGILGEAAELPTDTADVINKYRYLNVPAAVNQAALAATSLTSQFLAPSTMNKPALINSLGLQANATDTEVEMAVQAAARGAADYTRLKNELEADKLKVQTERAELLVTNAIAQKKIGAGQKEDFVKMAITNHDTVKAMLDGLPGVVVATNQLVPDATPTTPANTTGTGTEVDRANWTLKDYQDKDAPALAMMAEKEPAKYSQLLNAAYPNIKNHLGKH